MTKLHSSRRVLSLLWHFVLLIDFVGLQYHLADCHELELVGETLIAQVESLILLQDLYWTACFDVAIMDRHMCGILISHESFEELLFILIDLQPLFGLTNDWQLTHLAYGERQHSGRSALLLRLLFLPISMLHWGAHSTPPFLVGAILNHQFRIQNLNLYFINLLIISISDFTFCS